MLNAIFSKHSSTNTAQVIELNFRCIMYYAIAAGKFHSNQLIIMNQLDFDLWSDLMYVGFYYAGLVS